MKKTLFILLRLTIAAAGITYIAFSLTWTDHVIGPAGMVVDDGRPLAQRMDFKVIEGRLDPRNTSPQLVLEARHKELGLLRKTIAAGDLGEGEGSYWRRPGILTTLRGANVWLLLLGLALVGPIYPIQAFRWRMLLKARGLEVPVSKSFKLVMVGSFFNYSMPGSTGGDVVKAYYAAARSDRRADAIMTVVFDRIVGLLGLVLVAGLAGLAGWFLLEDETARRTSARITLYIWVSVGAVVALSAVYFSRRLRAASGLEWLMARLLGPTPPEDRCAATAPAPGLVARLRLLLQKIDAAAVAYRDHKTEVVLAILMSVPLQLSLATSAALAGYALGMKSDFGLLINVVPVLFLIAAIPIGPPQGFGTMEFFGKQFLLNPATATFNQIVGMLLLTRLFQVFYSLFGSLFLLRGDIHMHPAHAEEARPGLDIERTGG